MAWTLTKAGSKSSEIAVLLSEVAVDDSNKDLIYGTDLPSFGSHMELVAVRIEFTATATVGTRTLVVEILTEANDLVYQIVLDNNTVTASASGTWQLGDGLDAAVTTPQYVHMPAGLVLFPGQKLRIRDSAAIDAAADDMVLHVQGLVQNAR